MNAPEKQLAAIVEMGESICGEVWFPFHFLTAFQVLLNNSGDMLKALEELLALKRMALDSLPGKAAEEEEEAQLLAFQREGPIVSVWFKRLMSLQVDSTIDSAREFVERVKARQGNQHTMREEKRNEQKTQHKTEDASLGVDPPPPTEVEDDINIEKEFSIIAAEDDELDVSQIPQQIGQQLAEPPLFTICYSSQVPESITEIATVKVRRSYSATDTLGRYLTVRLQNRERGCSRSRYRT